MQNYISFNPEEMVEVVLHEPDDFKKVMETLTRIGIPSRGREKKLFQSCLILHKKDRKTEKSKYYIVHFKEMFGLDGKPTTLDETDIKRRNTIAKLLDDWNLVELVNDIHEDECVPINQIKILPFKEKGEWELVSKYNIGEFRK